MTQLSDTGQSRDDGAVATVGRARRTLAVAGAAHALHDGFTDLIYLLLPIWQAEFALGYGMLAVLRGFYAGAMAGFQVTSGRLAERFGGRFVLALGTALAGIGYAVAGSSGGLAGVCVGLFISGVGSSTQHPLASAAVARAYGQASRGPLGTYNFAGDIGKAALPAATSLLLTLVSWRASLWLVALLGLLMAVAIALLMPRIANTAVPHERPDASGQGRGGFFLLLAIGMLDSGVRMGFLTFLPFLLTHKGASLPTIGFALALVFMGGALGKFSCGWLGDRIGVLRTVLLTEIGTAAGIAAVLLLPLVPTLLVLPLLGLMLNGTSSVLYGTVPELTSAHRTERAFAIFYTGTIGSGALSPVLYGVLGDAVGVNPATGAVAVAALATCPLAVLLARHLAR